MQRAEALMEIIHERGKRGLPLERLYRHLFNPELYLRAYGKIYRNDGSMTPGSNEETVDGMSLKKILMSGFDLVFGALDFVITPDGEWLFLEINPTGQYGFIEHATGAALTAQLADLLTGATP